MGPTEEFYAKLNEAVQHFNDTLFDGTLPELMITVQRNQKSTTVFDPMRWSSPSGSRAHELSINPSHLATSTLFELFQDLVHNLCHCWQHISGKPSRQGYHNNELADKMISIGLQPSDTGLPGGKTTGQVMHHYPIRDGLFIKSALDLVEKGGWTLPWVDRECKVSTRQSVETWLNQIHDAPPVSESPDSTEEDYEPGDADDTEGSFSDVASNANTGYETDTQMGDAINDTPHLAETDATKPTPEKDLYEKFSDICPGTTPDTFNALMMTSVADHMPEESGLEVKKKKKKVASKAKYTCSCKFNIWGKPGLHVICGTCNDRFICDDEREPSSGESAIGATAQQSELETESNQPHDEPATHFDPASISSDMDEDVLEGMSLSET